jgi:hypothetical protein
MIDNSQTNQPNPVVDDQLREYREQQRRRHARLAQGPPPPEPEAPSSSSAPATTSLASTPPIVSTTSASTQPYTYTATATSTPSTYVYTPARPSATTTTTTAATTYDSPATDYQQRIRQLEEDERLARFLQEQEEQPEYNDRAASMIDSSMQQGQTQAESDEELARRLQEEEREYAERSGYAPQQQPQRPHPATQSQSQIEHDEALARSLQCEEQGDEGSPFMPNTREVPPMFQFRPPGFPYDSDDEIDPMPVNPLSHLRGVTSLFRTVAPPDHPLFSHIHEMMNMSPRGMATPDAHMRFPARRYRFPNAVFGFEGVEGLPPHLLQMMRGDIDTSYESLMQLADVLHPVSRGASNEQIDQLPTRNYVEGSMPSEQAKCGICLAEYENGDQLRSLACLHSFHKDCVDKWLTINKICPVCRAEINNS